MGREAHTSCRAETESRVESEREGGRTKKEEKSRTTRLLIILIVEGGATEI